MLTTTRCVLNKLADTDYADVLGLYTDEEVRKHLGGKIEEKQFRAKFMDMAAAMGDLFYWVVREKESENFIGLVSLDQYHHGVNKELSYQFLPTYWGSGYATEVVAMILEYALRELKLSKVVAETQTANERSCSLLERVGMKLEEKVVRFGAEQSVFSISTPKQVDRHKLVQSKVDAILLGQSDHEVRRSGYVHLYAVSSFCSLLALKRGLPAELAGIAGMLHDIATHKSGNPREHAQRGALEAEQVLTSIECFSQEELRAVCTAIANHSMKTETHDPFSELLKDADVLHHCLHNVNELVAPHETARLKSLCEELGLIWPV